MHHVVVCVGANYSCHSPFEVLLLALFVIPIMLPSWREQGGADSNTPTHTCPTWTHSLSCHHCVYACVYVCSACSKYHWRQPLQFPIHGHTQQPFCSLRQHIEMPLSIQECPMLSILEQMHSLLTVQLQLVCQRTHTHLKRVLDPVPRPPTMDSDP